ncbi:MAG: hypothetical protein KF760_07475 [Candidatus Eremiobacteraeota bacterium]|nr:hypothetical protein [Candidatus Eremiobacteraeota bacterium]MCW5869756.1 hypothetical protein [Candidatus Eremiobacteraeota bacterium]
MFFLATCLGSLVLGLMVAYLYAKMLADRGDPGADNALKNTAINATVIFAMAILMLGPGAGPTPWFKQPPVKSLYMAIATNLKPRDKKGNGWLAPQAFDKKEAKAAAWMYGLIHKGLTAAICAGLLGVCAALVAGPIASKLNSGGGGYIPPGPNRRPF